MKRMIGLNAEFAGLDPEQFRKVVIEGCGSYVLPRDLADAVAKMCEAAHVMTESIHGIQIPVYLVGTREKFIACIKFIRQVTGKNLRDAKDFCDRARSGEKMLIGRYPWTKVQRLKAEGEEHDAIIEVPSPLELLGEQAE